VKRAEGHVYVPTPVTTGAVWRIIGGVLFTVFDNGGGVIDMVVTNFLPYTVDAFLSWSWGGVNRQVNKQLRTSDTTTLRAYLPAGFDATLEISAES
jgi:hypothetical protein